MVALEDLQVALINPYQPELKQPRAYIPLGLGYIAAVLEEKGISVEIVNQPEKVSDIPSAWFYGVNCVQATYPEVKKLVKHLKDRQDGIVIVGGALPSVAGDEVLLDCQPDLVFKGESEFTFADFVENGYRTVIGRVIDSGIVLDLDSVPFPARHLFLEEDVVDVSGIHGQETGVRATSILTARGCPYNCVYCCKGHQCFTFYRYRSPLNVVQELKILKKTYGIQHVRFVDDEFTLNVGRTMEFMRELKKIKLTWVCITRADSLTEDMVKAMKKAGCLEIHIGVETGSTKLLKLMNKQTTRQYLIDAVKMIKAQGVKVKTYLMYNFPGETEQDRRETLSFLAEAKPDKYTLSTFTPLFGSKLSPKTLGGKAWFYPDEEDGGYLRYKRQIERVLKE